MPELPEVETVRRLLERTLVGKRIVHATVEPDEIVLSGAPKEAVAGALIGQTVVAVGRKGKYWWLELDRSPWLFGHLGMSGWIREVRGLGEEPVKESRLLEHGNAPIYDEDGRPRFLKLLLETECGRKIALTDGRRLARLWLANSPKSDERVSKLGPDMLLQPYRDSELHSILRSRKAPIKALLLDQKLFAGVGNWIADEVLYQSKILPSRLANTVTPSEAKLLVKRLAEILKVSIECECDAEKYPADWLFHVRWGGSKGKELINGRPIVREQVGGRTTAFVPGVQK